MSDQKNDLEYIRQYIQKHERYFEALGFQRPGGLPRYYTEQRPEEWPLDLAKVERLKREEQARERAASHSDRTASSGMSQEARDLLDSISSLAGQGLTPGQIAARLELVEDGVRNVLAMGRHADDPQAEAPVHTPEVSGLPQRLRTTLLVTQEVKPHGGPDRTATSTRSHLPLELGVADLPGPGPHRLAATATGPTPPGWCA